MIKWDKTKCCKCLACLDECNNHALLIEDAGIYIDQDACVECGKCVDVCPNNALTKEER